MYIITQNLLLPDKKMPPNPVRTVCVAQSSSFLISSAVKTAILKCNFVNMYTLLDRNRHDNKIETRNTYNKQRETLGWFGIIN